jgi:tetratricopeptide (TPR) repeat protein
VSRTLSLLLLLTLISCTTPLELGERRYRDGDRVAALEIWRSVAKDSLYYDAIAKRIRKVESELANLVVLFKKRGGYYERRGMLAESVLNYRLALKLQPDDRATLDRVQSLVRRLATLSEKERDSYAERFETGDLAAAKSHLRRLRVLDPFDPRLPTDERQLEETLRSKVEPLLDSGRRSFASGKYESAERAFRSVLELDPGNETAKGHLSFIANPPPSDATDAVFQAEGLFQNALGAERADDPFKAIEYDIRALKADPARHDVRAHLTEMRSKISVEALIQEGRNYYQQEDLEAALEQWRNALLVEPGNTQAVEYVARAEKLLENLERLRQEPEVAEEAP